MHGTKIKNLENAKQTPYFARIDFKAEEEENKEKIYVGKTNIFDDESNVAVADWRAPISSLYYDGQLGKANYTCPEGIIEGELKLKRVYTIEKGKLLNYTDVDVTTNDKMLQECLGDNSDARLKNIITTIQSEQNKVIRANMFKPLIVQGVAGSGKTTVALHRIAYLVYTYEKDFKPEDFLIIAPNRFFLDYISNVLPDLGVDYVRQETFEDLALQLIKDKIVIEDANYKLAEIVNKNKSEREIEIEKLSSKFKASIKFKELVDEYLEKINNEILEKEDFKIANITAIKYDELQSNLLDNKEKMPLYDRVQKLKAIMQNKISNNQEKLVDLITSKRKEKIDSIDENLSDEEKQKQRLKIFEETEYEIGSLLKGGKQLVIDYIKKIKKYTPLEVYKKIINEEKLLEKYAEEEITENIRESFNKKIKKKQVEYEDLAPLMYLQYKLLGLNEKLLLKHIIIDEAQDFGEFQFCTLYEILQRNKSITILGDIAQGIYSYRGTTNWSRINELVFNNEAEIKTLDKSYRTTIEIMNEANKILFETKEELNIKPAVPVARHGKQVDYIKTKSFEEKIDKIFEKIQYSKQNAYENIAVIARDEDTCKRIYDNLKKKIDKINIISEKQEKYEGGIIVIPSYFSKGLEFDSVVVADYNSYDNSILDKQLLYVAFTRAMHVLDVFE